MTLRESVFMLSNVRVIDTHLITIYEGTPSDMIRYFREEEKTLDYLNIEVINKIFHDNEVFLYLGSRVVVDDSKPKRLFEIVCRICDNFNSNIIDTNYSPSLNEVYRGQYIGIQFSAAIIGYKIEVKHYYDNCIQPIRYCGISQNGEILYEMEFIGCSMNNNLY